MKLQQLQEVKYAGVFAVIVLVLVGCTAQPTLYELETEAMVTGDWTAFDRKNKRHLERAAYADLTAVCDIHDMIVVCETLGIQNGIEDCGCRRR